MSDNLPFTRQEYLAIGVITNIAVGCGFATPGYYVLELFLLLRAYLLSINIDPVVWVKQEIEGQIGLKYDFEVGMLAGDYAATFSPTFAINYQPHTSFAEFDVQFPHLWLKLVAHTHVLMTEGYWDLLLPKLLYMLPKASYIEGEVDEGVFKFYKNRFNKVAALDWSHTSHPTLQKLFATGLFQGLLKSSGKREDEIAFELRHWYQNGDGGDELANNNNWVRYAIAWVETLQDLDVSTVLSERCPHCWIDYGEPRDNYGRSPLVKVTPCGHKFDGECLIRQLSEAQRFPWTCAMCRQNMVKVAAERGN